MNSQRTVITAMAAILLALPTLVLHAQDDQDPAKVVSAVQAFYRYHLKHDMGFTRANIEARKRWLSPALYKAIQYEFRRAEAFSKKHPDEVPFIDGDPFTDSQDIPDEHHIGKYEVNKDTGRVEVTFHWKDAPPEEDRKLTVVVINYKKEWLIHDILGADGKSLLQLLNRKNYME